MGHHKSPVCALMRVLTSQFFNRIFFRQVLQPLAKVFLRYDHNYIRTTVIGVPSLAIKLVLTMSRWSYYKNRGKKYAYRHRADYIDLDNPGKCDNYPGLRNGWHSGRRGHCGAHRPNAHIEVLRRVVCVDGRGGREAQASVSTGGETWARASVANAASLPVEFFKESISAALGMQIRIYNFMVTSESCVFYFKLRSKKLIESIQSIKAIVNPHTNNPIVCDVKACLEPDVPGKLLVKSDVGIAASVLPEPWMAALRDCFKERFQITTNSLDLSSLHTDLGLLSRGYYIALNKNIVLSSFIVILQENNARLSVLNLSNNRLRNLQPFGDMRKVLGVPTYSFERIDLSDNHITVPSCLEGLSHVPGISNVDLSDTPLAGRLSHPKGGRMLESQIVGILPGLKILNGKPIKAAIQVADEQKLTNVPPSEVNRTPCIPLPPSIQGHFGNEQMRKPLLTFLMEYFGRYDSQHRGESICPYYTCGSTLTMTVNPNSQCSGKSILETVEMVNATGEKQKVQLMTSKLCDVYIENNQNQNQNQNQNRNRNLDGCKDELKGIESVLQGPNEIASFLEKLPLTEHVLESFSVDIIEQTDRRIIVNVVGVFYEVRPASGDNNPVRKVLRCFNRSMILVAPDSKILHESIVISNPTEPLIKRYIRDVKGASKMETPRLKMSMRRQL